MICATADRLLMTHCPWSAGGGAPFAAAIGLSVVRTIRVAVLEACTLKLPPARIVCVHRCSNWNVLLSVVQLKLNQVLFPLMRIVEVVVNRTVPVPGLKKPIPVLLPALSQMMPCISMVCAPALKVPLVMVVECRILISLTRF